MRITGARTYYTSTPPKMPAGLVELIEGMTREVLKHNPNDLYGFCAGHMQQLLEKRDGPPRQRTIHTLEQKILLAQKKVKERIEKRRQQYDENILLQNQHFKNTTEEIPNKAVDTATLHENNDTVKVDEKKLSNSLEIEISHGPCTISGVSKINAETEVNEQIRPAIFDEPEKVKNELIYANQVASQVNENVIDDNVIIGSIVHEGNMSNETLKNNYEDPKLTENNTIKQNIDIQHNVNNTDEQKPDAVNIKQNTDAEDSNILKNNVIKILETNEDKLCLRNHGDDIKENEDNIPNDHHANTKQLPAESTVFFYKESDEIMTEELASTSKEIDAVETETLEYTADTEYDMKLVEHTTLLPVTEIQNDEVVFIKNETTQNINNIDTKSPKNVEKYDMLENVEEKTYRKNLSLMQTELPENEKEVDKKSTIIITDNEAIGVQLSDVKDKLLIDVSLIDPPKESEEKISLNISVTGDEGNNVHNDIKKDNNNELYVKHCNVNHIDPENDNISTDDQNTNVESINSASDSKIKESNAIIDSENIVYDMNLETAAVTIQKVFRSFLFKSRASTSDDTNNDDENSLEEDNGRKEGNDCSVPNTLSKERRPHGITRMDTVLQTVNEEKSLSLSTDDSSTLSSAATIIQAHVRGFLVRNKLNSNKTLSTNSFTASNSNEPSLTSQENDNDQQKNKTVLNIHIVPEGHFLSKDESLITSMELSLDGSPPSSVSLHPLGYNKSERRKQLKREDAIQSISPPSNNSGKLSEDVDSVKEVSMNDNVTPGLEKQVGVGETNITLNSVNEETTSENAEVTPVDVSKDKDILSGEVSNDIHAISIDTGMKQKGASIKMSSDEMDVVTPFISSDGKSSPVSDTKLMHSGEFHDALLPTRVSRNDTTVVREFKSVLVYFLLWNPS